MTFVAVWHGSDADLDLLRRSVGLNCECKPNEATCAAHKMLTDQYVLDHMVFARRLRFALKREEWLTKR